MAAFEEIMTHGAKTTFKPLLQHLATYFSTPSEASKKSPTPVPATILHCTTGNNRSGVFVALLLSLIGVPDEQVAEEYALSQYGLTRSREATINRLMKNQKFVSVIGTGEEGRRKALGMVGARKESMLAFLGKVRERWGSVESFAQKGCGVESWVTEGVRRVLVESLGEDGEWTGIKIGEAILYPEMAES